MKRNSAESQAKILKIAEHEFAQKGFNGARVDEIAKKAKVNKALIYYYFKNKNALLDELFKNFIQESTNIILKFAQNQRIDQTSDNEIEILMEKYISFLEEKKDILRVLVIESIKSNDATPALFDFVGPVVFGEVEMMISMLGEKGFNIDKERNQMLVTEFFTGIIPTIFYVIFQDQWCKQFDVTKKQLKKNFQIAMEETHVQHHLNKMNIIKED